VVDRFGNVPGLGVQACVFLHRNFETRARGIAITAVLRIVAAHPGGIRAVERRQRRKRVGIVHVGAEIGRGIGVGDTANAARLPVHIAGGTAARLERDPAQRLGHVAAAVQRLLLLHRDFEAVGVRIALPRGDEVGAVEGLHLAEHHRRCVEFGTEPHALEALCGQLVAVQRAGLEQRAIGQHVGPGLNHHVGHRFARVRAIEMIRFLQLIREPGSVDVADAHIHGVHVLAVQEVFRGHEGDHDGGLIVTRIHPHPRVVHDIRSGLGNRWPDQGRERPGTVGELQHVDTDQRVHAFIAIRVVDVSNRGGASEHAGHLIALQRPVEDGGVDSCRIDPVQPVVSAAAFEAAQGAGG